MRKIFYVLAVMLVLVLAACAKTGVQPQTNEQKALNEQTTAKAGATVAKGCDWTADNEAKLEAQFNPSVPMVISKGFDTGKKDDCMSFGVLAVNIEPDTKPVYTQIEFSRAYDVNSNPIEVDKASLADWIADNNDPRQKITESGKFAAFPYFIKIRTMKPGVDPVPGTYAFIVTTWSTTQGVRKQIGQKEVSVKVQP